MLVIVSDLHLTDDTSGETIKEGAFRIFRERLRDMAIGASWRADKKYRPIKRLDLLLLGDILDVIRSSRWLDDDTRPWSDRNSAAFKSKVAAITDAILQHNAESLACLKALGDPKVFSIPREAEDGPSRTAGRTLNADGQVPIETHVHYLIGNHDWFFGLLGREYDDIRKKIVESIGLSNSPAEPFPYDVNGSEETRKVCAEHRVFARHGDFFDPFNYEGDRTASSLGDAIVVELLNRFPAEVTRLLKDDLPKECLEGLKEIDNVRPLPIIPVWIDGLLQRTCPDPQQARQVKAVWDRLADAFLELQFVRDRDKWYNWGDRVDQLELALKFSKGASLHGLSRLLTRWSESSGKSEQPFCKNALQERAFKNRAARYIVYGHTHYHEIVPLDSCYTANGLFNQMYLNAGTWRRVHELAKCNPKEEEFMGYDVMSYLAFFKGDECGGRTFESWSGALGG